jgi:hypothetical protein
MDVSGAAQWAANLASALAGTGQSLTSVPGLPHTTLPTSTDTKQASVTDPVPRDMDLAADLVAVAQMRAELGILDSRVSQ